MFLWPEEADFRENLHRVVYVIINKRSLEYFMCLDPIVLGKELFSKYGMFPLGVSCRQVNETQALICNVFFSHMRMGIIIFH